MALSTSWCVSASLLRTFRNFAVPRLATRSLRSDATRLKPLAVSAAPSPRLSVVEGSVVSSNDAEETRRVFESVNAQIAANTTGRLFAIVYILGKQFKVTAEDLVLVQADLPVEIGDSLRLEKVLLVGARDFTLLGRPMLDRGLVRIDATVVEKTLSQTKRRFHYVKRSRYERHHFYRFPQTILRVNSIQLLRDVNAPADTQDSSRSRVTY
ncbi:hypothetical protein HPB50_000139 [Hyalomma asiaticum]|uniref:Uncharacterized protein n=1 Tax=Hyalomma asiaticum TaxID=266040 RepID=A0ACB7RZF7_HYAAI|nr:hypothetical protein HPB50_000139 [Hyalomma asiaticum]